MTTSENAGTRVTLLAFGRLVKRLRIAADLTQEELAERASVSPRLISELERGSVHRPRRDTVQLLADGLRLRGSERDAFIALARGRPVCPPRTSSPMLRRDMRCHTLRPGSWRCDRCAHGR